VVIAKKISKAQPGESSKKPKGSPIIDLSDDKEVCISYLHSNLFRFSLSLNSKTNLLQDSDTKTIHEHTLARIQSEKRSKKKHESDASDSTAKIQDPQLLIKPRRRRRRIRNTSAPRSKLTRLKKEVMKLCYLTRMLKGRIEVRRKNTGKENIRKSLPFLMIPKLTLRNPWLVKSLYLRGKRSLLKALCR
jgi:hypothetical protein